MTTLYVVLAIVCFSALSLFNKLAQLRQCDAAAFVGTLNAVAGGFGLAALLAGPGPRACTGTVLALGLGAGVASALCLTCVIAALRHGGPLAIVTTLGNLSILLPILVAVLFFGERLTVLRVLGLALFVVFVVLLNWPETTEAA